MYISGRKRLHPILHLLPKRPLPPNVALGPSERKLGEPLNIAPVAQLIGCSTWTVRQTLIPKGLPHFSNLRATLRCTFRCLGRRCAHRKPAATGVEYRLTFAYSLPFVPRR